MRCALKSIGQFAVLGALLGFVFAGFWWIANHDGYTRGQRIISASEVTTMILAPGVTMFRGTDGAWVTIGEYPEVGYNLELLGMSSLFNCVFYAIFATIAIVTTRSIRFMSRLFDRGLA